MKYRSNLYRLWIFSGIAIIGLVIGLAWANYRYSSNNPGGNEFLTHWMGTRELLLQGQSPYSEATAQMSQNYAYGRLAQPGEPELRETYPLYSVTLFFPFALIPDFNIARSIWMTVLEISLLLIAYISIRLSGWKPGAVILAVYFIFAMVWFHSASPLINGNPVILITLVVTGAFIAIRNGADELAGVLLALSTIEPLVSLLIILFIIIWAIKQKRLKIIGWFSVTLVLFITSSLLLIPDWFLQNLREIFRQSSYSPPYNLSSALISILPGWGKRINWAIAFLLALILLLEWGKPKQLEFKNFYWTACITLVISQWIGIKTDPDNFILLFPCIPLVFSIWEERWKAAGKIFSLSSMFILLAGLWFIFLKTTQPGFSSKQNPILFLPLPFFLFITLYWVRWWAIHPQKVWMDDLISIDNSRNY